MEPGLFISTSAVGTTLDLDALSNHYTAALPTVMLGSRACSRWCGRWSLIDERDRDREAVRVNVGAHTNALAQPGA